VLLLARLPEPVAAFVPEPVLPAPALAAFAQRQNPDSRREPVLPDVHSGAFHVLLDFACAVVVQHPWFRWLLARLEAQRFDSHAQPAIPQPAC